MYAPRVFVSMIGALAVFAVAGGAVLRVDRLAGRRRVLGGQKARQSKQQVTGEATHDRHRIRDGPPRFSAENSRRAQ